MSKAVLVMDMPESCSKCKFSYEFYGAKKCHILNLLCNGGKSIIPTEKYAKYRHRACPLVRLPDENPSNPELRPGVHYSEAAYEVYKNGWKTLWDKIMGR